MPDAQVKRPPSAGGRKGAGDTSKQRKPRKFTGTSNPRHLRALQALLTRPQPREAIDRRAGCSNGPELVAELRRRGLQVPCELTPCYDRDGFEVRRGVYYLTERDRRRLRAWQRRRARGQQ